MYKVNIEGKNLYFATLDAAKQYCNEVVNRSNVILGIEAVAEEVTCGARRGILSACNLPANHAGPHRGYNLSGKPKTWE